MLLLGGAATKIVGAIIIAGQEVDILSAEARVVICRAGVDLALDGGNANVESAADSSVDNLRPRKSGRTSEMHTSHL